MLSDVSTGTYSNSTISLLLYWFLQLNYTKTYTKLSRNYDYNGHFCVSHTLSFASAHPFISTSDSKCIQTTSFKYFQSIGTSASQGQATFQAYPVIIVQDSRSSTSLPQATDSAGSASASSSTALSTGAKIAIGVCIPVGIIILAALVFIWWHRRRVRARSAETVAGRNLDAETKDGHGNGHDVYAGKPELDGSARGPIPPAELPALQSNVLTEMPSQKSPDTPQAELPGDFGVVQGDGEHGSGKSHSGIKRGDGDGDGMHSPVQDR